TDANRVLWAASPRVASERSGGAYDAGPMRRSVEKVDVEPDVWSVAVVVAGLLVAAGVTAVFRAAPATLTRIAIGILLALALDPVVRVVQRRSGWPRLVAA